MKDFDTRMFQLDWLPQEGCVYTIVATDGAAAQVGTKERGATNPFRFAASRFVVVDDWYDELELPLDLKA
jgi:hypothetical protein